MPADDHYSVKITWAQSCKNCRHAKFDLKSDGSINPARHGVCTYKIELPVVPECVKISEYRLCIWVKDGKTCKTWEKK